MNFMDILRSLVYLLVFIAVLVTASFTVLNHLQVLRMETLWMFSPAWIAAMAILCILSFVGFVAMFSRG